MKAKELVPKVVSLQGRLPVALLRTTYDHKAPYQTVAERPAGITQVAFCTAHCTALAGLELLVAATALAMGVRERHAASKADEVKGTAVWVGRTSSSESQEGGFSRQWYGSLCV
jgi:hypothetical protein